VKILAVLSLVSLALVARPVASAAAVDPCKIASIADASKALGEPVVRTQERTLGAASCAYKSARFHSLVVTVEPFSSPAQAKSEYQATITSPATQDTPDVKLSGIGDAAQRLGAMIYVLKGNSIYAFSLLTPDTNGAGALRTIALARTVVPKL
jgi:hypothetical protein